MLASKHHGGRGLTAALILALSGACQSGGLTASPVAVEPSSGETQVLEDVASAIVLSGDHPRFAEEALTISVTALPDFGTLDVIEGAAPLSVTYTPGPEFSGPDAFTFVVIDPDGRSSKPSTVEIVVEAVNDAPEATAVETIEIDQDTSTDPIALTGTDAEDAESALTVTVTSGPAHGSFDVEVSEGPAPFEVVYTPDEGFSGEDAFTFTVTDTDDAVSGAVSVTITVNPVGLGPDPAFGTAGVAKADFGNGFDFARGAVLQPDGKIVLAGQAQVAGATVVGVARFNADGSLDATFGGDGTATTIWEADASLAFDLALQADGKIVVAGSDNDPGDNEAYVSRFNADGSLDASFGTGGTLLVDVSSGTDRFHRVLAQSDGKIVLVGREQNQKFMLARLNADGSFDTTLDGDGRISTQIFFSTDYANSVALLEDGSYLVAGLAFDFNNNNHEICVMRHLADGTVDTTFDGDGIALVPFEGEGFNNDRVTDLVVQGDGKIVVATSIGGDYTVVRLEANGAPDATFGTNGIVQTDVGGFDTARSMLIQKDGRILVAGDSDGDIALVMYGTDGTVDVTFGSEGILEVDTGDFEIVSSVLRDDAGAFLIGGTIGGDFAVVRLR